MCEKWCFKEWLEFTKCFEVALENVWVTSLQIVWLTWWDLLAEHVCERLLMSCNTLLKSDWLPLLLRLTLLLTLLLFIWLWLLTFWIDLGWILFAYYSIITWLEECWDYCVWFLELRPLISLPCPSNWLTTTSLALFYSYAIWSDWDRVWLTVVMKCLFLK